MLKSKDLIATKNLFSSEIPDTTNLNFLPDGSFRIAVDGTWYYRGSLIRRPKLIKFFSEFLSRDYKGNYWLVTPSEIAQVIVEDAPFTIDRMSLTNQGPDQILLLQTNVGKWITVSIARPIYFQKKQGKSKPYMQVEEDGTEAIISRSVYYELTDFVEQEENRGIITFGIWSSGTYFSFS
ncbi:MAG: hypothetical protein CFH06_00360 [Alphaproteobacteria bacterium MarineAlpha3_Bin5]|mgnify:CR=1 FL=1|nr:MAG: hypothetical protein CFH06_00360 [Alphaproteobacteria bacterium MarineAlpha3_Bin5]|tara:strand:+ start:235 stop:774 length:540 start_codon:yes stop_codon:yes gene_type:complete